MNNNRELLEEYAEVTKELDNIKNQIIEFKNKTQEKLKSVQSEDEEMSVFLEYKNQVDTFTQDKETKKKYKMLQKRKHQIENSLCSRDVEESADSTNSADSIDSTNKKKYKIFECNNSKSSKSKSTSSNDKLCDKKHDLQCDESSDVSTEIINDINILIKKYKKFVKVPIVPLIPPKSKSNDCQPKKKPVVGPIKKTAKNDEAHMEGLANLINSLKGIDLV